jgi:hypothetical protein
LYRIDGKLVYSTNKTTNKVQINLSKLVLTKGNYLLKLQSKNEILYTKIVID